MKIGLYFVLGLFLFASCKDQSTQNGESVVKTDVSLEELKADLKRFEDSLKSSSKGGSMDFDEETAVRYAEKCLLIKNRFPKSEEAPALMNKAHVIFSSVGLYQRSVLVADSLIIMYPMYEKRAMVLESLASSYDIFIVPRRKEKVKKYYEMLLAENPKMNSEQRHMIEQRLKWIDLPFEEYIQKVNR